MKTLIIRLTRMGLVKLCGRDLRIPQAMDGHIRWYN